MLAVGVLDTCRRMSEANENVPVNTALPAPKESRHSSASGWRGNGRRGGGGGEGAGGINGGLSDGRSPVCLFSA